MTASGSTDTAASPTIAGVPIEDIGVLSRVAIQINELAEKPDTTGDQIAELLVCDPTLTSKVLRILNSAFYGLRREVRSVRHAVAYLGVHQIRNLAMSSAVIEAFAFEHGVVEPAPLWEHSLGCAIAAKRVGGRLSGPCGDEAYLGGLLHDVGRIVLLSRLPDEYARAMEVSERGLCSLRDAEQSHFKISHDEAGCLLGKSWGFSEAVVAMIRHHHHPAEAGEFAKLTAAVSFANAMCHQVRIRFGFEIDDELAEQEKDAAWEIWSEGASDLDREQTEQEVLESLQHTKAMVAELF